MAPVKTSPWAGLSEMTAVASTVDARSKVRAPEVVICPEGVTVTAREAVPQWGPSIYSPWWRPLCLPPRKLTAQGKAVPSSTAREPRA